MHGKFPPSTHEAANVSLNIDYSAQPGSNIESAFLREREGEVGRLGEVGGRSKLTRKLRQRDFRI